LHDGAATIAHDLGKRGAQSITAGLNETFTKPKEKEKFSPSLRDVLTRPATVLSSAGTAVMQRIQNTPWSQIGGKVGYAVGAVVIQVAMLVLTEGIGNLIEQGAQKLASIGGALGKLTNPIGTALSRVAAVVTEVEGATNLVQELIGRVIGTLVKPLEGFRADPGSAGECDEGPAGLPAQTPRARREGWRGTGRGRSQASYRSDPAPERRAGAQARRGDAARPNNATAARPSQGWPSTPRRTEGRRIGVAQAGRDHRPKGRRTLSQAGRTDTWRTCHPQGR